MPNFAPRTRLLGLMVSAMLMGVSTAEAGLLSDNSGGAISAFTGTQLFDGDSFVDIGFPGFTVSANVDFAVFAPGAFGVAFPGQDPSGGADYVYAYQINNLDTNISKFTVGLDGDEPLGSIGSIADVGAVDPSAVLYVGAGPTSSAWDFAPVPPLANGFSSAVLFFTSAAAPELDSATVAAAWSNSRDLPSPLPEPATLSLLVLGASMIGLKRRPQS